MRNLMKMVKIISSIVFGVLFTMTLIASLVDLTGIFSIPFIQPLFNDNAPKVLLFLFSSVGIVVLIDALEAQSTAKVATEVLPELKQTINIINNSDKTIFLANKREFYLELHKAFFSIKNGSEIFLTNYGKNFSAGYDQGEFEQVKAFMKLWDKLALSGDIVVKQLVHITSLRDLDEAEARVSKFTSAHDYSVRAAIGLPIVPFIDYLIIDEMAVFMGFPDDSGTPYDISFGLAIFSEKTVKEFIKYFNIYWSDSLSINLKTKDQIDLNKLKEEESILLTSTTFSRTIQNDEAILKLIKSSLPEIPASTNSNKKGWRQKLREIFFRKDVTNIARL